jgi:protein ATS1
VAGLEGVVALAVGMRHCVALDRLGRAWGWGAGGRGQLGRAAGARVVARPSLVQEVEGVTAVSCGQHFTVLSTAQGPVGLGCDRHCQVSGALVMAGVTGSLSCGWTHVVALAGGVVRAWGRDSYHQLGGRAGGQPVCEGVRKVVAGSEHCLALTEGGGVLAWGWNEHGSCGQEGEADVARPAPVPMPGDARPVRDIFVGSAHCFALT